MGTTCKESSPEDMSTMRREWKQMGEQSVYDRLDERRKVRGGYVMTAAVYSEFGDRYADEHNTPRTAEVLVTIDEILPPQRKPKWMFGHYVVRRPARRSSHEIQAEIARSLVMLRMYHLDFEDKAAAQEALEELHSLLVHHGWRYTGYRGHEVENRQHTK